MADPFTSAMMLGGLGLSAYGVFGGQGRTGGLSQDQMFGLHARRLNDIYNFQNQLTSARANYQNQISNFYNNAFSRFTPIAEAQFASRGLNPFGGAYQSALGKKAAEFQDAEMVDLANREREDIMSFNNALAQNDLALMGSPWSQQAPDYRGQAFGSLGANMFGLGLQNMRDQRMSGQMSQMYGGGRGGRGTDLGYYVSGAEDFGYPSTSRLFR